MTYKISDLRRALVQTDCHPGKCWGRVAIIQRLPSAGGAPARVVVVHDFGREIEWFAADARFAPILRNPSL